LCEAANCLGFGKDLVDGSRNIVDELEKMELTEQEHFTVVDKILSMPHRLHIFMGCRDATHLAFLKSLIE
jgi:nucleoside-triphosphatase THEP1